MYEKEEDIRLLMWVKSSQICEAHEDPSRNGCSQGDAGENVKVTYQTETSRR